MLALVRALQMQVHPGSLAAARGRDRGLHAQAEPAALRAGAGIGQPSGGMGERLAGCSVLRDRGGSTQQALAATLAMDGTNIVGLLNELEARKLIERRRSPEDRRRHQVELTDAGAEQLAKAERALSAVEDEVLGALDESQRETLYSLLQQAAAGTMMTCTEAIHD